MLIRPEFVVVTGVPNHGKSIWVRALCCHLGEVHGFRSAILAPEEPAHRIKRDLRRFAIRKRMNPQYSGLAPEQRTEQEAIDWIDQHFRFSLPPEEEPITMEFVEAEMASAALHHGCQIFVLDPWNEIAHVYKNETQYIEGMLPRLKQIARRYGLMLIIVAHPRKMSPDEIPCLYSISGSANWKNKCDHGIIINRMSKDGKLTPATMVIVEKSKDHETMGEPGSIVLAYNREVADYFGVDDG
jgi:twinkle protein